eukprot:scaffold48051_cov43-Cyclotella_meneghiniana.AAC.2
MAWDHTVGLPWCTDALERHCSPSATILTINTLGSQRRNESCFVHCGVNELDYLDITHYSPGPSQRTLQIAIHEPGKCNWLLVKAGLF